MTMKKIFAIFMLALLASCGQNTDNKTANETKTETTQTTQTNACDVYFEKLSCSLKSQNMSTEDIEKHISVTRDFINTQPADAQKVSCEGSLESLKQTLPENC